MDKWFPAWKREVNVYNKLLPSWRISLCKVYTVLQIDRKSTRLNSSHTDSSRMPSSA